MSKRDTKKRESSRSLARKLNAELAWQKCFRNITVSILILVAAFVGWCYWNELAVGGGFQSTSQRNLTGQTNFFPDGEIAVIAQNLWLDVKSVLADLSGQTKGPPAFSDTAVFHDVVYSFAAQNAAHSVDCTALLNVEWWLFFAIAVSQLIEAAFRSFVGSDVIRKYLRPIDEIAVMAEKLSSETADRHTTSAEEARREQERERDGDLSGGVKNLAVAIDRIEDSGTRIEVHDTELGGLEAALNNMLKRLDESKRSQIRFVDDASHELRTPIAVIQGYAGMLDRWGKEDEKVRDEAIEAIKTEADHMKTLVDQLLFLARGEMDRHVFDMTAVNLYECLDEIVEESVMLDKEHRYLLSADDAALSEEKPESETEEETEPPDVTVTADAAMLKQCIRIIRDNAAKYTPAGGEITFRALRRDGEVIIEVQDTGIGIPAEEIPRIFDRFYRGSNARGDNAGGSGLGLSIAKWIVDQHGGRMEAVSVPELGTKMKIVLAARE